MLLVVRTRRLRARHEAAALAVVWRAVLLNLVLLQSTKFSRYGSSAAAASSCTSQRGDHAASKKSRYHPCCMPCCLREEARYGTAVLVRRRRL